MMPWMQLFATVLHAQAQSAAQGGASLTPWLLFAVLVSAAAIVLLARRMRELARSLRALEAERASLLAAQRESMRQIEKQTALAGERQEEVGSLKRELGAQRKKVHAAQEEVRTLREEMRAQMRTEDTRRTSRPAFEPAPVAPPPAAAPERHTPPPPTPVVAAASDSASAQALEKIEALRTRVDSLVAENTRLAGSISSAHEQSQQARVDARHARDYAEKLRRIDVISKSKIEVLEDKLNALGRSHYDAVSELAALRGEVVPPRREHHEPAERPFGESSDSDAVLAAD